MELEYTIKRSSRRKTLTITVERDRRVVVHAPVSLADEKIRTLVDAKRQWIYQKIRNARKYNKLPHPPGKELVNGESAIYLGRSYQIELTSDEPAKIRFDQRFLIPISLAGNRKHVLRTWYIGRAKEKILPRVRKYAHELGVSYAREGIVDNRYRWGSCTPENNVCINWRLIKAPMFVIDYVIIHELAHLLEENHTQRFWNIIRAQSPKMEKAKTWLLEHGQILEEEI